MSFSLLAKKTSFSLKKNVGFRHFFRKEKNILLLLVGETNGGGFEILKGIKNIVLFQQKIKFKHQ